MMKVLSILILVFSVTSLCVSGLNNTSEEDEFNLSPNYYDTFDWNLMKEFLKTEESNVIISPFAIKLLLSVLLEATGLETTTYRELSKALLTNVTTANVLRESSRRILNSLHKENEKYALYLGTAIFVDHHNRLNQQFGAVVQRNYHTKIEFHNFRLRRVPELINAWASQVTHNQIKEIVTSSDVDDSVILLLNVIYFHGKWLKPFNPNKTRNSNFYLISNRQISIPFIKQKAYFYYCESTTLNAKFLRLQYEGKKFAMTIVLPNEIGGIDDLIKNSNIETFQSFKQDLKLIHVRISLPKFDFGYRGQLVNTLKNMGIKNIFTDNASLSRLANGVDLSVSPKVSRVVQEAAISITEEGTTVNATTYGSFVNINSGTEEFIADHPFLFFIEDEIKGAIIMSGRVSDPSNGQK